MKKKYIFIILAIIILLGGISVFSFLSNKVERNPDGTVGNTAGNLYNNGLFCETDNLVFFSNPYDEDTLYVMASDESSAEKLTNVGVKSINAAGDYVYYYQHSTGTGSGLGYTVKTTGMYRMSKNGNRTLCLKRDPVGTLNVIDNNIFYQHYNDAFGGFQLDSISIDKENEKNIFESIISPACAIDGIIFYNNPTDNNLLYNYDTRTGNNVMILDRRVYNPIYHTDGYIYYMDIESDYQLHRYDMYSQTTEVITTDRVETYNIYEDYIYYQKFSETEPALMRVHTDGSGLEVVSYGNYENINITSNYVYFNEYNTPTPVYHQSLWGAVNVGVFQP